MPGSASVELHIFDETRADEAYQIFKARLEADYPEATITEDYTGYDATDVSADGTKIVYGEVNKWYNDTIGCYVVTYTVYFTPIEPMIEDDVEVVTDEEAIQSSIDEVGEDPSNN
jgi:Tol biopolymer transport system component